MGVCVCLFDLCPTALTLIAPKSVELQPLKRRRCRPPKRRVRRLLRLPTPARHFQAKLRAHLSTLYYLVCFKYPFEWVSLVMPPAHFCHALCTVPLHIFIYDCVFQDQNEWQIGFSEINIAAEVGASWSCLPGRVSEWKRLYQSRFCSCLSAAPQVTEWRLRKQARTARRKRHGIH